MRETNAKLSNRTDIMQINQTSKDRWEMGDGERCEPGDGTSRRTDQPSREDVW